MIDEEINIAIAEVMRWTVHHGGKYCAVPNSHGTRWQGLLFDPCNDLNACAEMEKVLTQKQAVRYRIALANNSGKRNTEYPTAEAAMCHATARERATCFVKVIGKWQPKADHAVTG